MKLSVLAIALLFTLQAFGSLVAIVDSGVDYKHHTLKDNIWMNPGEIHDGYDNDGNGKRDDIRGWNIAEDTSNIFNPMYEYLITKDILRFYDILAKATDGSFTQEDVEWYREKKKDRAFVKDLLFIGGYAHGTHVAGISKKNNSEIEILIVKYLATNYLDFVRTVSAKLAAQVQKVSPKTSSLINMKQFKQFLTMQGKGFGEKLEKMAIYVDGHKVKVANGSFGFGYKRAVGMIYQICMNAYQTEPTILQLKELTDHFIAVMVNGGKKALAKAPNTLFVFAAGNDSSDNDLLADAPSNIKRDNTISVAATYGDKKLANFSNYGSKLVEVAAPGVNIYSACPGQKEIAMSGTSQAAPYVTNIASKIVDANSKLSPKDIKDILINTVDKKNFLKDKVLAEGIVNEDRAVYMAKTLELYSVSFEEAKRMAYEMYPMKANPKGEFFQVESPIEQIIFPRPLI